MKVMFAVAAAHDWRLDDTAGYQTCLIKASIDNRVFKYPEHIDNLPHINPIGKISQELAFFSVQRHVASARSFNSYPSLLQLRLII